MTAKMITELVMIVLMWAGARAAWRGLRARARRARQAWLAVFMAEELPAARRRRAGRGLNGAQGPPESRAGGIWRGGQVPGVERPVPGNQKYACPGAYAWRSI